MTVIRTEISGSKQGFSLITVLIVMMAGFAMIGVTFYMYSSFTERSLKSVYLIEEENLMDDGMEKGWLAFERWIHENGGGLPVAVFKKRPEEERKISKIEDLLIARPADEGDSPWAPPELDYTVDISGNTKVSIKVEIFDIAYTVDQLHDDLKTGSESADAERAKLPPAFSDQNNYLIRVTMRIQGVSGATVTDMAFGRVL